MILANPRAPPQHGKSAHTHDSIITMLRFLARDGSNAEVIAKLKRSADASAVTSKAKKILTSNISSKTPVPPLAVVPKPVTFQLPATANVSALTSREALEIIQQFKSEDYFVECGNTISAPEDEPELIPREVVEVVESLRVAIEIKFGEKKPNLNSQEEPRSPFLPGSNVLICCTLQCTLVSQMGTYSLLLKFSIFQKRLSVAG